MKWTQHSKANGYRVWVLDFLGVGAYVEEWTRHKGSPHAGQGNSCMDDSMNPNLEFVYSTTGTLNYFNSPEEAMTWQETRFRKTAIATLAETQPPV